MPPSRGMLHLSHLSEALQSMQITFVAALCLICGIATGVLARFAESICTRLRLMDVPGERKHHSKATPLLGGLALTCVILPLSVVAIFLGSDPALRQSELLYVVATFALALVGMADDRRSVSARDRILLGILVFASIAMVDPLFNVRVLSFYAPGIEFGLAIGLIAVAFTTLCCVGLVNAINMADGKNGLVIGLCIAWLLLLACRGPASLMPVIALLLSGLVVLFYFNMRGHLFLGDGGSYGFATAIGLLTIASYNSPGLHSGRAIYADQIMVMFAVPVLDSFRLTFVRLRRGQSPMAPDRDHLHHLLQNKFGWPKGLAIYIVLAVAPSLAFFAATAS